VISRFIGILKFIQEFSSNFSSFFFVVFDSYLGMPGPSFVYKVWSVGRICVIESSS
jgi:hypothetical protein